MFNTDEAVDWAESDIARNGPFPRRNFTTDHVPAGAREATALRADDDLYRELGAVARQRLARRQVDAHQAGGENYWRFWTRRWARQVARAALAVAALVFVALVVLGTFARGDTRISVVSGDTSGSLRFMTAMVVVETRTSGDVFIDWSAVERETADDRSPNFGIARMLVAARDGTWKPMEARK